MIIFVTAFDRYAVKAFDVSKVSVIFWSSLFETDVSSGRHLLAYSIGLLGR